MASRTVAGGRRIIKKKTDQRPRPIFRPRQPSRREFTPSGIWYETPIRGLKIWHFAFPLVSHFARDHRLPYVTPSGVGTRENDRTSDQPRPGRHPASNVALCAD